MALAAGLHGVGRFHYFRPGKIDQFGSNFKVRIIVDSDVVRPFKKISGRVQIETNFPIKHYGIHIQFEAMCILRYQTKFDNRTTFYQGRECILEKEKDKEEFSLFKPQKHSIQNYQESPIQYTISTEIPESAPAYTIAPGSLTYPFHLEIPGDPHLPAAFKNSYGCLTYRLVVYMRSDNKQTVEVGEKIMRFAGHHNLLDNVEAMRAILIEQSFKKSVFSTKKLVEMSFYVETSGYLPEETIPFLLFVKNPKLIPLQMSITLLQQIKYTATRRRDSEKKRFFIAARKEKDEYEPQPETTWKDCLYIPDNQIPSYTRHFMHNVTYSLQFKVKILDHGTIKGESPIFIGTTRDPAQVLMSYANNLDVPFQRLSRRGSASSAHSAGSHNSVSTTFSLPPAYSQLTSRIPSLETLPPTYDEIGECDTEDFFFQVPDIRISSQKEDTSPEEEIEIQTLDDDE